MRALTAQDPDTLGGHRLLARLGSGGMGTVYLARSPAGALVAVKVIRAEHAADPAFRARFRREVRLASGLEGRWVVPVTAADADAQAPWLATAFVPGPSLAEAVDAHGALPPSTVLTLGARLAQALSGIQAAGLVHRDVKPGNILLALDGPRLIDFGIASGALATALTAPDAVIGTPGYLSPEQTRAHGGGDGDPAGPASDVFSLGCVLAYATTARRPFGTGDAASVLYRTVHEQPDLAGLGQLPPPVGEAVARCLAKDAGRRPTAAELRDVLVAHGGDIGDGVGIGIGIGIGGDMSGGGTGSPRDWLPPVVLRLVAERSARALDPPPRRSGPDPASASASAPTSDRASGGPFGPSRRRLLGVSAGVVAAVGGTGVGAVWLTRRTRATGGAPRARPTRTLALHAALTGGQRATGTAHERGARLAVAAHNARADAPFRLALRTVDDGGVPDRARDAARAVAADPAVLAVIGPTTEATARAASSAYAAAALPVVVVSVDIDAAGLSTTDLRTLCATRPPGTYRHLPILDYLHRVHPVTRTAVIEDLRADDTVAGLVRDLLEVPPRREQGGTATRHTVAAGTAEFGPVVAAALAARPGAIVYAGTSPGRGAACARALADAGFTGPRATIEPVMRPAFLTGAGGAAEGWLFEAPYTRAQSAKSRTAVQFTAAHRERYGTDPAPWAAETYDAVGLLSRALTDLGSGGDVTPGRVADRLFRLSYDGIAKRIRFRDGAGHQLVGEKAGFLYRVEGGGFRYLGRHDQVVVAADGS
ncbi:serine/threonine protein kinase [Streptomyces dioscori]|uniref:Serine/threonine protein kinase n=1 Tax=Streptomyces dioscori TaxID=2109333 RepID=A0A2P8Q1W2_9ACTN|nr:bifunctional serine/threonine-protein kinase/ABC transporter substrate-binding protein [Streptomyces dioscori]PSM40238.1 serine/threonine protein kinase [Streptomyces dioscori]